MSEQTDQTAPADQRAVPFDARSITRPDPALLKYYLWVSLCGLILFPFIYLSYYLRYRTLRYKFDDEGVSVAWGVFNRREIVLTYRRIQDIHVTHNLFQRWAGIASLNLQTASASAGAEMTIEGVTDPDGLRDFLYLNMRGARDHVDDEESNESTPTDSTDELLTLLTETTDALRRATRALESSARSHPNDPGSTSA